MRVVLLVLHLTPGVRLPVGLTAMRSHTRSAHKMSIAQYKETHGNHRERIIQRIYHRCGLCQEVKPTSD